MDDMMLMMMIGMAIPILALTVAIWQGEIRKWAATRLKRITSPTGTAETGRT